MITSLQLRNFRAFRDQRFEFSKINIFVGANSTGKSSAISAINFIAQSILPGGSFEHTNCPQRSVEPEQLGTFIDVVHGNRANTPLGLEIAYTTGSTSSGIDVELKYRRLRRELEISQFAFHQGSQTIYNYRARKDSYDIFLYENNIENIITGQKRRPNFQLFPFDPNVAIYSPVSATQRAIDVPSENEQLLRDIDAKLRRGRSAFRRLFDNFDSLESVSGPAAAYLPFYRRNALAHWPYGIECCIHTRERRTRPAAVDAAIRPWIEYRSGCAFQELVGDLRFAH